MIGLNSKLTLFFLALLFAFTTGAQPIRFSLASDGSAEHSFKKGQRYWAYGQTVCGQFHITPTDALYAWLAYYGDGKFKNDLTATAKSPTTNPQTVNYRNNARLRFKHISLGWKRYFKGDYDAEKSWNLYGYAGFGLLLGRIENSQSIPVDSAQYLLPLKNGKGNFKRLTFDVGSGVEFPAGASVFLYLEARALIPTTDYPSPYLFVNRKAPLVGAANLGIRILIN